MVVISYILLMSAVMLWGLRIMAAINATLGTVSPITVYNFNVEIVLLFTTFFSLLFILKRKILGAIIYMVGYIWYFGNALYNIINAGEIATDDYINIFIAILCILVPICIFFDIGLNRNQKNISLHKKTDWFYKNKEFDREFDERADRNQYKF